MEEPLFSPSGINHVALRVTDLDASARFYQRVLGARVYKATETARFLEVTPTHFVALFTTEEPHIEHFCFTLPDYEADEVAARLDAEGIDYHRVADRVFAKDPDGLLVQLSAEEFE